MKSLKIKTAALGKKICLSGTAVILAGQLSVFAQTTTFNFTGSVQTYTVPPCVTQIVVDVRGAQGRCNTSGRCQGGLGGRAQGTITVTPGEVLQIYVGGGGGVSNTGGYNGGGNGGFTACGSAQGAGGGGGSDIRRTPYGLGDRLVVGGGGGGTGGERVQGCGPGSGAGGGGGWYGGGGGGSYSGMPGTGGSQVSGGTGGLGGAGCPGTNPGTAGGFGTGGSGGGVITNNQFGPNPGCTGGAGGTFTGATGVQCTGGGCPGTWAGGSGGGGSNYTSGAVFSVTHTQGFQSGNGQIFITTNAVIPITLSGTQSNVTCSGSCNGSATVSASGGTAPYTYLWNTVPPQTSPTAVGLCAGTYNVIVTDATGCTSTANVTITQPTALSTSQSQTNLLCNSQCNGTATVGVSGGTPGYNYSWNTVPPQTSPTAVGLCAGSYAVTITDANGCTSVVSYTITQPTVLSATLSQTNVLCNGTNNGTATVTAGGGTPGYAYSWSTIPAQTSPTATGLSAGTYTVTITDANGCTTAASVTITQPTTLSSTQSQTNVICNAQCNGTAAVTASGGTPGYNYSWSTVPPQTSPTAIGLCAGNYSVIITDANGCTTVAAYTITEPTVLSATLSQTNVLCNGVNNGTATVTAGGGTPGYAYSWNTIPAQTSPTATGLSAGTYTITITDANGCTTAASVTITQPTTLSSTQSQTNVICNAQCNGTAAVTASGGTPGYNYSWSTVPPQTSPTATGLCAGNYSVTIADTNGCTSVAVYTITEPTALSATLSQTNALCNGTNNGTATVTAGGGTPGYAYSWSTIPAQTSSTATGLSAGTYSVTIADTNGCTIVASATITQPTTLSSTQSQTNVICNAQCNGTATVAASGGTPSYTYSWNTVPPQATPTATGLCAGNYSVTITDANGCTSIAGYIITEPTVLSATLSQTNVLCNGVNNGSATVTAGGGTPGYTYSWSTIPAQTSPTATGLPAGTYTITVTDANGCTTTSSVTISQPTLLSSTQSQTNVICNAQCNGSASVTASGGTPSYTYSWNTIPPQSTSAATGLCAGNYSVTITDANGCTSVAAYIITEPTVLSAIFSQTNLLCNGGNNGSASASVSGGTPGYTYLWSNGQTTFSASGLSAGNYSVTITDANGCTFISSVSITEPPLIILSASGSADSICILDSIILTSNITGGTPAYTFVWQPGSLNGSSVTVAPSTTTTYTLSVTDANGCTASASAAATVFVFPSPSAGFDTASMGSYSSVYSFSDLSVGGNSWFWDFGDGSTSTLQDPMHNYGSAGTYTITQVVLNQYGCPDTFIIILTIKENILIPNVFSPDGDGNNDVWYISNTGIEDFYVEIFDRWGSKVFETAADEIRWDGRSFSGNLLLDGTYFFSLRAKLKSGTGGKDYNRTGYISLITKK